MFLKIPVELDSFKVLQWQEKRLDVTIWKLPFPEPDNAKAAKSISVGQEVIFLSPLVQYYHWVIDMEVIIVSLTWLLSQCVGPVDWTYPNHYLLCEEKYYSITLYASVNQTQSFPSVTLIDVESCMAYLSSTTPSSLILYKKVRMHIMLGLLRSTKSLCCSWSFMVLPSSAAVTELRKLCLSNVRNHYTFTTCCCSGWPMSAEYRWSWVWPLISILVFWSVL